MADVGNIKIAPEVISTIAAIAATEVTGVAELTGGVVEGISNILGKKQVSKGIKVELNEEGCTVEINIVVEYGVSIRQVALTVQESVVDAVTNMSGLGVNAVNVYVQGIKMPKLESEEVSIEETV